MSGDLLAILYAGLLLGGVLAARAESAAIAAAARGAWLAAVVSVTAACLMWGGREDVIRHALGWSIAPAGWTFATGLALDRPRRADLLGLVGAWLTALGGHARGGWIESVGGIAAVFLGVSLSYAMRSRRWPAYRLVAYTLSFFGTFAVYLPLLLDIRRPMAPTLPDARVALALVLAAAAVPLGLAGARDLLGAGGTPEPLDPPPRLCTTGIYRHIRHPLQIAELLAVFAGALAVGSASALLYATCFTLGLLGPMRILEERTLYQRHGEAFARYRTEVPAYLPRWRS